MKKRIGTAILAIVFFALMLQPAYAAGDRIDVVSAYVMDEELLVFLDVPDSYDPTSFQVFWDDRESKDPYQMSAISNCGKCAHYLFLTEHSVRMEKSADTVSAFIRGIDNKEKLAKDLNLCFYDSNGLEPMIAGTADQLSDKLEKAEYRGRTANPYNAVLQAFDELGRLKISAGDPVYVFLITSGASDTEGTEHRPAVKTAIASHHEVMFGTLCTDRWQSTDAQSLFTTGTAMDFVVDDNKQARESGEEFASWAHRSLNVLRIGLKSDELKQAKAGKLEIKLSFEGGKTYSMGGSEAQDVPKQNVVRMKDISVFEAEASSEEEPAQDGQAAEDNDAVSENTAVSDNAAVSGNEAVSDNAAVSGNEAVSDNAAVSGNDAASGNEAEDGRAPWSRGDKDKDEDDEEEDEDEESGKLPGFVIPLAIGGGVLLILIVVILIVLLKGRKRRTPQGQDVNMPEAYGTTEIPRTEVPEMTGTTVAISSAAHSRPSNVDQAEDALLAMTIEVYAGHCMRSSAVIYLHDLISFGSDNICDVLFMDEGVEAEHLRVSYSEGRVIVEDMSVCGVYVNGMRIQSRNPLRSGDVIGMGEAEFALKWSV